MLFHWLDPSRRSRSPDRPFPNPRASAFLFPRSSVSDTPRVDDAAASDGAFPISRHNPFLFPRVGLSAFPLIDKCWRRPEAIVIP